MSARNLGTIAAAISRRTEGIIPFGEIVQAINDANQEIQNKYEWPWRRAETNIHIKRTYSEGTITVLEGSNLVTGTGVVWDTAWLYKRFLIGNTDYLVDEFTSATTATLVQAVEQGHDFIDSGYTI